MDQATPNRPITIVAVDDHPSYAHGLKTLLESLSPELSVVGVGTNAHEGMRLVDEFEPDIVLMDVRMPTREGVEAAKKIRDQHPLVKIVMLTASDNAEDVIETLRAGVRGYLMKDIDPEELVAALRVVMADEVVLAPFAASLLLEPIATAIPLTDEQIHILKLLAEGVDLAEAAKEICVSESTLKRSIRAIQEKLQVDNRMQAVVAAAKRGLI